MSKPNSGIVDDDHRLDPGVADVPKLGTQRPIGLPVRVEEEERHRTGRPGLEQPAHPVVRASQRHLDVLVAAEKPPAGIERLLHDL